MGNENNLKSQLKVSLFADEKKIMNILYDKVVGRIDEKYLPKSILDLPKDGIDKMIFVDSHYQMGYISQEMAVQIMSSIIEYYGWMNRLSVYNENELIEKIKEIHELLWKKRKKEFISLENKEINKIDFCKINSIITQFERNNYVNNLRIAVILDNPNDLEVVYNKNSKR